MKKSYLKYLQSAAIICLLSLLLGNTESKQESQWTQEMETEFGQRSRNVVTKLAGSNYGSTAFENEKKSYPKAMTDFLAGNSEKARAFLQAEDADADRNAHTLGIDFYSGFTLKGQVRKYFYFGKYLNKDYRQRMKKAMQIFTEKDPLTRTFIYPRQFWSGSTDNCNTWVDCRNTDNLKAMREVAVYLFAEETGQEETRKIYKERISRNVRTLYQIGQGEWDSETYLGHAITTYVNLYDFAVDPEVKSLAKSALDWFLTTGALKYWRGGFGGPSKRDYSQGNCTWCSLATHSLGLYFGDSPIPDPKPDPDLIHLITSNYRPPTAVVALARKQFQKPVELLNSKPTYENWLPGGDNAPQFHETLYFGHTFGLGTLAQGSSSEPLAVDGFPGISKVANPKGDWNGFKMMTFNTQRGVDYFIAATGTNPAKISTSSIGGDNVAQYRNLVIWLNDKPNAPFQFFLPKSARVETVNGVTFIRYEKTWLALSPINLKVSGINPAATEKMGKRYRDDQILTATGTNKTISGFALEVGELQTHGSWEQFKQSVQKKSRLNLNQIGKGEVEYLGVKGKVKLRYLGRSLPLVWRNGQFHDWHNHYAVYQSADGTKAPIYLGWKEGKLKVEAGGHQFQSQP